jgi:NAD(P)H-hydrate epimerase
MTLGLPETKSGSISLKALPQILQFIQKRAITSLAIGPGLSRNPETGRFVRELVKRSKGISGAVLDADGFLAFSQNGRKKSLLAEARVPLIVTPHEGELARFLNIPKSAVRKDRTKQTEKFAKLNRAVCVLKGSATVISDGQNTFINSTGNPGMAKGGSGDVLTGLISALIPQTEKTGPLSRALQAACAGVYSHGLAGDQAKKEKTEVSMLAGDISDCIPNAFKIVRS